MDGSSILPWEMGFSTLAGGVKSRKIDSGLPHVLIFLRLRGSHPDGAIV